MLAATATTAATAQQSLEKSSRHTAVTTPIKMERRDSSTSESSLEHLDLGRTPKKLNTHSSATSTPHVATLLAAASNSLSATDLSATSNLPGSAIEAIAPAKKRSLSSVSRLQQRLHDSDETNDYDDDDDDSADEKLNCARSQRHHKRRGSGRMDKRASVQLEYNADNPNSLRKKFRFNRTISDLVSNVGNSLTSNSNNNESGFVDASCSSQYLNASATTNTAACTTTHPPQASPHTSATASHSSSASSSPHGAGAASVSSPESGIGEREDIKYVCPICDVVSATPHEFTNHIRCHNYASGDTENFTCRICSKVLSSASSLDRHVLVHTGERPFNCKYCHLTFTTNGNMHRHMRTHKQHQHNHHHRRNSNGTKNNNNNNNNGSASHNNSGSSTAAIISATGTQATPASGIANVAAATATNAQLTNGSSEGVKSASAAATLCASSAALTAAATTGVNGKRLNGSGVESYESDGGCSTDSSSAISQSSNHNHNNNNNNNNSNNNYNMKAANNNNSLTTTMMNSNDFKRKNSDHLDVDEIALMKRRVKTTINNNNNIIGNTTDNENRRITANNDERIASAYSSSGVDEQDGLACPVCNAADFDSMLSLGKHMDTEHSDIAAKCRHCDVVFRTHRQLNVHPCTHKALKVTRDFKDHPFGDFSSEKDLHMPHSDAEDRPQLSTSVNEYNFMGRSKRRYSESSAGAEEEPDEEQQRRDEFFRQLYVKNKALRESMHSLSSPQHSTDDALENIKYEADGERMSQNLLSQSHDSKDLADIQSILNMTSSSSTSNFLKNFEQSVNTPSSNYGMDKDEEEAQDAFTSEFRKMKLRGEFPCKLCTAVFPNLRALKGHNRIHLSAAGPAGPFRCNMCPYSICDKAALVRHMRTHNGDRPYECAVCNYAFTTKANCERHLRNRHAKTTRDDVKRAIIYHPSEDSTCDDPTKKLHMFSSPDFDDDIELPYQHHHPKDRSTPVSHLKEMLTGDSPSAKPMKIQVKSLEQLLDKSNASSGYNENFESSRQAQSTLRTPDTAPIDLSMDVLDLSKKPSVSKPVEKEVIPSRPLTPPAPQQVAEPVNTTHCTTSGVEDPKFDLSAFEHNQQQLLLAQQQLLSEAMPKMVDPAHYFQQLYRNLVFQPLNPFFMQNSFLPNNLSDLQKFAPLMSRMFGGASPAVPMPNFDSNKPNTNSPSSPASTMQPQASPLMSEKSNTPSMSSTSPASAGQMLPKSLTSPTLPSASLNIPRHPHMQPTVLPGGPVKMVIKNGVLMPKQKQRRYRTERPFACEHCSARFTLRSNMERHVKQQHPQFYAQRQRSGHHIMRGRGASSSSAMNNITHLQAAFAQAQNNGGGNMCSSPISEQVKYAILAQQLKARKEPDLLQQALAYGSSSVAPNHMMLGGNGSCMPTLPNGQQFNFNHLNSANVNGSMEDDEPKLIIDEDDEDDDDIEEIPDDDNDEDEHDLNESISEDQLPTSVEVMKPSKTSEHNEAAKKVADNILEQIKAEQSNNNNSTIAKPEPPAPAATTMKSMIAQAESVGKFLKEVASSPFKDESQDLVPVAKLVDNATSNAMSFNSYFRPSDVANHMEQSDEEGLVASGSASESNNSGTEDIATSAEPKKKSAYSLAPNRVSCPYCQRMFPWSSSLRRHILTHTGQKPFKCSHCPLLFTTKSNCDRHLLRKHGNVESAVSVYVPTEDVSEPIPVPKSVEEIEQQQRQREEEERRRKAEEAQLEHERREKEQRQHQQEQEQQLLKQLAAAKFNQLNAAAAAAAAVAPSASSSPKPEMNNISSSELPFKCHLCENSFGERFQCLGHIKSQHAQEFALLLAKSAIDTDAEANHVHSTEDDERRPEESTGGRSTSGKYPDYSNRKVICAFCMRRFWSTEDLRRHMRTHSGERPFQCDICLRKFTLKHSMLRHMKKHNGRHHNGLTSGDPSAAGNSGSDFSDDEQMPTPATAHNSMMLANTLSMKAPKIQDLLSKSNEWRSSRLSSLVGGEQKENISEEHNNQSDLIGNLLGISDQGILNKLLSSPDEAAKLLGVEK